MVSLINKQLLLTAYAYLFITEQQKAQQGSEALQLRVEQSDKALLDKFATERGVDAQKNCVYDEELQEEGLADVILKIPKAGNDLRDELECHQEALKAAQAWNTTHPIQYRANVVPIVDWNTAPGEVPQYLATEKMDKGDMEKWMKNWKPDTADERDRVAADFRRQMTSTLTALEQKGLVHRDVKPGNIFVSETGGKLNFWLGDFGLSSTDMTAWMPHQGTAGTPLFSAPSHLNAEQYKETVQGDLEMVDALAVSLAKGFQLHGSSGCAVPMVVSVFLGENPEGDLTRAKPLLGRYFKDARVAIEESEQVVKQNNTDTDVAEDLKAELEKLEGLAPVCARVPWFDAKANNNGKRNATANNNGKPANNGTNEPANNGHKKPANKGKGKTAPGVQGKTAPGFKFNGW